ncbi:MAG TPA: arginase family protein [Streptosporangiaceae bacterium]|nr:arginase family protein [Streptosporangiaceae bacterium]
MSAGVSWACLGVPIDSVGSPDGGPPFGTELAPSALRDRDIVARLGAADRGDAEVLVTGPARDPVSGIVGWPSVGSMTTLVRAAVGQIISGGQRPFLLGGCCALVMGAVAGARDRLGRIGLVNVDDPPGAGCAEPSGRRGRLTAPRGRAEAQTRRQRASHSPYTPKMSTPTATISSRNSPNA